MEPRTGKALACLALVAVIAAFLGAPQPARAQAVDAVAREFTVLNDISAMHAVVPVDTSAREVTILNDLRAILVAPPADASAREVTVLNSYLVGVTNMVDADAREVTVLNDIRAILTPAPTDAIAREFTVAYVVDNFGDVRLALQIAGGLVKGTSADVARLDVVGGTSAGKVDVRDAIRIVRRLTGLDP